MEHNWAAEHLQVIRTLMERAAIYRRALAPIMTLAGAAGTGAGLAGYFLKLESARAFAIFWMSVGVVAVVGAFLLVRRQALKDAEPFWSLPTRRVTSALLPPLCIGLFLGLLTTLLFPTGGTEIQFLLSVLWILLYGCALHSAGFFMPRGIRFFGWCFVFSGCVLIAGSLLDILPGRNSFPQHFLMGLFFGVTHLAYGLYLYSTEKRKSAA